MAIMRKTRSAEIQGSQSAATDPLDPAALDPSTKFLYTPHTVTALLLGVVLLVYYSRALDPPPPPTSAEHSQRSYDNAKYGVWAAIFVFLGYSVLHQGTRMRMVRPHPAVWRLANGVLVTYLLFLVFLIFQDVGDARAFFKHLYPDLGQPLQERMYGTDCRLYIPGKGINWEVIGPTVFDEFVIAHTLGWWAKALIIRNRLMLWTLSILFELMEQTFQHMLPNFNECWWDSWVLDVLVCNLIGLEAGMRTVRWFGSREYNWSGLSQQPTILAKAQRSLMQFTPYSWDDFDWRIFTTPKRCLQCLLPVVLVLLFEVNAFFLKYILWVPPRNPLNTYRLVLLLFLALPAFKEYYFFLEEQQGDVFSKLGSFAWLGVALALAETLVCVKFGRGLFPAPAPPRVLWAWGTALGLLGGLWALWAVRFYVLRPQQRRLKRQ